MSLPALDLLDRVTAKIHKIMQEVYSVGSQYCIYMILFTAQRMLFAALLELGKARMSRVPMLNFVSAICLLLAWYFGLLPLLFEKTTQHNCKEHLNPKERTVPVQHSKAVAAACFSQITC